MGTKQKHAEMIKAWADGEDIQFCAPDDKIWFDTDHPKWDENIQYRIKPTEQKTVELYQYLCYFTIDGYFISLHVDAPPIGCRVIRRLDETKMVVEV